MDTIETLDTEQINPASSQISEVSTLERLTIINNEDKRVAQAVSPPVLYRCRNFGQIGSIGCQ